MAPQAVIRHPGIAAAASKAPEALAILDGLAHVPRLQAPQRCLDTAMRFLS